MIKFFLVIVLVGSWEDYSAIIGGEGKISLLGGDISIILIVCIWIYKFIANPFLSKISSYRYLFILSIK